MEREETEAGGLVTLAVGKYYATRNGDGIGYVDSIGIEMRESYPAYVTLHKSFLSTLVSYTPYGVYFIGGTSNDDLVREIPVESAARTIAKWRMENV